MMHKIFQWHCCVLKANHSALLVFLTDLCLDIVSQQETFIEQNYKIKERIIRCITIYVNQVEKPREELQFLSEKYSTQHIKYNYKS